MDPVLSPLEGLVCAIIMLIGTLTAVLLVVP